MKTHLKNIILLICMMLYPYVSFGQEVFIPYDSKEKLKADVEIIVSDFDVYMSEIGIKPPYKSEVNIQTAPFLIKLDRPNKSIILPYWDELMDEQKELFKTWRGEEAEEFFTSLFNWFFIPHELGHLIELTFNTDTLTPYESEIAANEFAIKYLSGKDENKEKLQYIKESLQKVLMVLPDIDFGDMSEEEYFNTNYNKLGRNPNEYGYFQFNFILETLNNQDKINLQKYCE